MALKRNKLRCCWVLKLIIIIRRRRRRRRRKKKKKIIIMNGVGIELLEKKYKKNI